MTIDEAIKINTEVAEMRGKRSTVERREALWLGIEALHRCQEIKNYSAKDTYCPLPGEIKH